MANMPTNGGVVTQITTVKLPPDKQDEVLALMTERAQFMAKQPGFVSICLYRSTDGSHVVNHVQWTDADIESEIRKRTAIGDGDPDNRNRLDVLVTERRRRRNQPGFR